ncbi:hypothetical protein BDP27DRAFT_1330244 [Rhodocollybia butyracea]|uniref:Uncharacterized protein n=1 Tax=Rhodocollybia butyracea TaxID=206335 RepID=A0A9P5PQA9_9AGAR|nr:hypothetical protein BDP27DRAFT_1330244 [Rhodocollybia butyracea]
MRRAVTPSLEASQQQHIGDLVKRNRAHEQTIQKLKDELMQEKNRAKATVQDIQNKLHSEKREWRDACDILQVCHRIHELRLQVELEAGKSAVLAEQELLRKEKIAILQREFTITKFQAQESFLTRRVEELEDEVSELEERREDERSTSKAQLSELAAHLRLQEEQIEAAEQAKIDIEAQLNALHKANTEIHVSSESLTVKLERTQLQLDGERSKNVDLERANADLKRTNEELKRQVAKWQSLESKGDTGAETERAKRVEVEVQLYAIQNQLAKREEENATAQKKLDKAKTVVQQWKDHADFSQEQAEEAKSDLAKLENANKKLVAELEVLKRARSPRDKASVIASEDEVVLAVSQSVRPSSPTPAPVAGPSRRKPTIKPGSRTRKAKAADDDDIQEVDIPSRSKGKGKAKVIVPDSEAETETDQPKQTKSRSKPKSSRDTETETDQRPKQPKPRSKSKPKQPAASDSEIEDISPEAFKAVAAGKRKSSSDGQESEGKLKGKRKASPMSTVEESGSEGRGDKRGPSPAKKRKRNEESERPKPKPIARPGKATVPRPRPRAGSTASTVMVDPEPGFPKPGTTKRRKINLFANKVDLGALDFGSQGSGIPSVLSPLKPQEGVPARSLSFFSSMSSILPGRR